MYVQIFAVSPQIVASASLFARIAKLDDVSCEKKLLDLIVITER